MAMVASFDIEPVEDLGYVLHQSIKGDKVISDLFHFLYTLKKMQDQGFIQDFVRVPHQGGIWFLKMNETRYKHIRGKWHTQKPYYVTQSRIDFLFNNIHIFDHWDQQKKQSAKNYYNNYHGFITKSVRNIPTHKPTKKIPYCDNGTNS